MAIKHFKSQLYTLMTATLIGSMLLTTNTKADVATSLGSEELAALLKENEVNEVDEADNEGVTNEVIDQEYADYLEEQKLIAQDLLANGTKIDQSVTKNGITIHFERMLVDRYSYRILCSMEKADHTAFTDLENLGLGDFLFGDEKNIQQMIDPENAEVVEWSYAEWLKQEAKSDPNLEAFIKEDGTVDEDGAEAYLAKRYEEEEDKWNAPSSGGTSSWGVYQIDLGNNKIYFLLEGSEAEALPKEAQIYIGSFEKGKEETYQMTFDMISYLKQQKEAPKLESNNFKNQQLEWVEQLKQDDPSQYEIEKKYLELLPDKVLAKGKVNAVLCKELPTQKIDNVGFVNGQLQIVTKQDLESYPRNTGTIMLVDQKGNIIFPDNGWSDSIEEKGKYYNYDYTLFNVKDINELSQFKMDVHAYKTETIAEGPWTAKVTLSDAKYVTKKVNKEINYTVKDKAKLSKVDISPLSITITFENIPTEAHNNGAELTITMKDGTVYALDYNDSESSNKNMHRITYIVNGKSINPADVASITFLGQNIKL